MQRIGIITIIDQHNFGNRLQNYALQEALGRLGMEAWTIPNAPRALSLTLKIKRSMHEAMSEGLGKVVDRKLRRLVKPEPGPPVPDRYLRHAPAIGEFSTTHIREASLARTDDAGLRSTAAAYDCFVVGSDQVWNPFYRHVSPVDFLTFAPKHQRVAYAASFGVPEIPAPYRSRYRRYLRGLRSISVREQRAAEIVEELTGRRVPVVLDPTLLRTAEDWGAEIPDNGRPMGREYLLTFFLSEPRSDELARIASYAAAEGLDIVDPFDPVSVPDALSPLQFIGLIRGARVVATDSFHASVFTVLFKRGLILKGRDSMESRTETLLASLGLGLESWRPLPGLKVIADPDWDGAHARLDELRAASLRFLSQSLQP